MKAIILDDDPMILVLMERVLRKRGYEVESYANPTQCPVYHWETCHCQRPNLCADVIITDFNMPFVSGIEFIERLRGRGCQCKHIALMSGTCTAVDVEKATSLEIKFFMKPFNLAWLGVWLAEMEKDAAAGDSERQTDANLISIGSIAGEPLGPHDGSAGTGAP